MPNEAASPAWQPVLPGVLRFRDSCNVYAITGDGGTLLINAGTGRWLGRLNDLPAPPAALLCTHYFRDHSAGAADAARAGIPVHVPEGERDIFTDPAEHFRRRETYIIYDNLWDLFAPIEPIPVAGVLRDYDKLKLAGVEIEVVPLPGAALTQIGLLVRLRDGRRVVFCGEAIHSPGRIPRVAPLQYNYNDLGGAINCYYSAQVLRDLRLDALLPSLGEPLVDDIDGALASLQRNLRAAGATRADAIWHMDQVHADPLERVTEHVWRSTHSNSRNWFLISRAGKALALDYGYRWNGFSIPYALCKPYTRRALLHGLDGLKKHFGIDRIDVALISHFHDDHVCGVPVLQRLFGTECWAGENFADLLEHPEAHCFPCNWPVPIKVNRRLPLDREFQWEEYTFRLHPMNGHTRFSALIGFEADGKRFAHTGDQYFFQPRSVTGAMTQDFRRGFADQVMLQNHVYRNGALLNGYEQSAKWMLEWRPDIVLTGHQPPMYTDDAFFRLVEAWGREYRQLHENLMPLGERDVHFNLDSWGGWIWPYRTHLREPAAATVTVTVRNPLPTQATLDVRLVGPHGWSGTSASLAAPPRAEVSCELTITAAGPCRRQPFAVELTADGRPFGQVAEALMTVGGDAY